MATVALLTMIGLPTCYAASFVLLRLRVVETAMTFIFYGSDDSVEKQCSCSDGERVPETQARKVVQRGPSKS